MNNVSEDDVRYSQIMISLDQVQFKYTEQKDSTADSVYIIPAHFSTAAANVGIYKSCGKVTQWCGSKDHLRKEKQKHDLRMSMLMYNKKHLPSLFVVC